MHVAALKLVDVANGPGVRVSLFVSGCEHACPGCFNAEAWDFAYGELFTQAMKETVLQALQPAYIRGFSVLGGEPLHPRNRGTVLQLLQSVRAAVPHKDVWCYTGYDFCEELWPLCQMDAQLRQLLLLCDVLVDGRFVEAQKNLHLRFRGSANQKFWFVRDSLEQNRPLPCLDYEAPA